MTLLKKWKEDLNRHLSEENMQLANNHIKKKNNSSLLIITEMQIKTTVRCHHTPA